ncbi:MAG: PilZ domain-containing protein [Pseudomonadales bacterium]|nr:PilZ domain-containing protein [Pseudomonadales bacterium]
MQKHIKQTLYQNLLTLLKSNHLYPESATEQAHLCQQLQNIINKSEYEIGDFDSKEVNILLADLRSLTKLAEQYSDQQVLELLNRYFHQMSQIILSYGGTIESFMGDSIMVLFGMPAQKKDDLSRCLACAVKMQIAMENINKENKEKALPSLYMGIGINSGPVFAGNIGGNLHNEYTVIGDEVKLASRIEAHSLRGQILVSENCYQKSRSYIQTGDINELMVKGKKQLVRMYELLSVDRPEFLQTPKRDIRKSTRISVDMPLAFYCLQGKGISTHEYLGKIVDIGYGGLFAYTPYALTPHSEIKITLSLSLLSHGNSDIYARVLRSGNRDGKNECHLEFTAIETAAQIALKNFVDQQAALL